MKFHVNRLQRKFFPCGLDPFSSGLNVTKEGISLVQNGRKCTMCLLMPPCIKSRQVVLMLVKPSVLPKHICYIFFWSIIYNRAKECIHQNFLRLFTWLSLTNEINSAFVEIQITVICSCAILCSVKSECCVTQFICKTWTGTLVNSADPDQMPQNAASDKGLHCWLKLQEVRVK